MEDRRTVLIAFGFASLGWISGCLDTVTGGSFSDRTDPAELSAKKGELIDVYAGAIDDRNEGVRVREDAIRAFNEEAYGRAIQRFDTASVRFTSAIDAFSKATNLAHELGEDEAATICETAGEESTLQLKATEAGLKATRAANGDGSPTEINGHVEKYRDLLEQAEEVPLKEPQTLVEVIESG